MRVKVGASRGQREPQGAHRSPDPGELLIHPVSITALALLLLNDHVLKAAWPGPLTGKLSDVAGMVFFPVFLISAWEIALAATRRWIGPSSRALTVAVIATTVTMALIKTLPVAAQLAGDTLGLAQWLIGLPSSIATGDQMLVTSTVLIADPTDVLAIPGVALPVFIGIDRIRRARARVERPALEPAR